MKRTFLLGLLLLSAVVVLSLSARSWGPHAEPAAGAHDAPSHAVLALAGCADNVLPAEDEISSDEIDLPFEINFFGRTYTSIFVNNNGNVTFDLPLGTFTPLTLLHTSRVIIAPFFADVDTRSPDNGATFGVVIYGATSFGGYSAFCVTWVDVGYFFQHSDKLNRFQLLLIDRSDIAPGDFDILMNYDRIEWETGDASGGINGLGGNAARVGYANGSTAAVELPGSGIPGSFLDSNPAGLMHGSRDALDAGRYLFAVRNGPAPPQATPAPLIAYGDANCDGAVNTVDAALALQFDAGLIESIECRGAADVNGDGVINSLDASLLLQFDAGLISRLGPTPPATPTPLPTSPPIAPIALPEQGESGVAGFAAIVETGTGGAEVGVIIERGLEEGAHMNHLHEGRCDALGVIHVALTELQAGANGRAGATTSIDDPSFSHWLENAHALAVHALDGTVVACGNVSPAGDR